MIILEKRLNIGWWWPKVLRMDAKGIESLCVIPGINHSGPRMVMGRKRAVIAVKKRPENDAQMQCIGASSCCQAHVSSVHANRQFFFSAHTFHVSPGPFCKSVWMCMMCMCELQLNMDVYMSRVIHIYKHLQWSPKELHSSSSENKTRMVVLNITTCTTTATLSIERLSFHVLGNPK